VFGIFIALLFMKLYAFYQPYADDRHDELQEIAQYQVGATPMIRFSLDVAPHPLPPLHLQNEPEGLLHIIHRAADSHK